MLPDHVLAQTLQSATIVRAIPELISNAASIAGKNSDNVTALAMMWESNEVTSNLNSTTISTKTLPIGSVTTTIQAPRHADLDNADLFNDNEIEKAIEEIRSALDKTTKITSKN
jgi:protein phosphatase